MTRKPRPPDKPERARSGWTRLSHQPWVYGSLFALSGVIVIQHLFAHAGFQPLPMGMGWQDLVVGYPMAVVLGIVGLILWGSDPTPR